MSEPYHDLQDEEAFAALYPDSIALRVARRGPGLEPGHTWRARMPRGVLDPIGPHGEEITTPADRRMLWHIDNILATATVGELRQAAADLHAYLAETCEHHWLDSEGDNGLPDHRQCMWCAVTEPL